MLARQFTDPDGWELQNMLTVARLMVEAALAREESRGVHLRTDFPADGRRPLAAASGVSREASNAAMFLAGNSWAVCRTRPCSGSRSVGIDTKLPNRVRFYQRGPAWRMLAGSHSQFCPWAADVGEASPLRPQANPTTCLSRVFSATSQCFSRF